MRIHIWKAGAGLREAMVVPSRRAHLAPLLIRGSNRAAFLAGIAEAVEVAARAEAPRDVAPVA